MDTPDLALLALKTGGPLAVGPLARRLGVSRQAARIRLDRLVADGFVACEETANGHRRGRGRPAQAWSLTAKGHARFPNAHERLTVDLIAATRSVFGDEGLDRLIAVREAQSAAAYRQRLAGAESFEEKLDRLAAARTAEGYMARWAVRDGVWLFVEDHCPICAAASACQGFCRAELELFSELLAPAKVERTHHLLAGARRCVYRITPPLAAARVT
ncbi:MAG TPA: metalloregulator ArsR/SmtB family transcription factor [Caulobacteraceae bacterium]|nr:metalloregulator ArsR/SmtB family transcription factor [Caulobacteraceae bacterium]